jgi:hypothetical protein
MRALKRSTRRRSGPAWGLALALTLACSGGAPVAAPAPAPATQRAPVCRTKAEVIAAYGAVCAVVGVYELKVFPGKGGGVLDEWPVVVLADGGEVMIESLWDKRKKPDAAAVARHRGRRVEVVGALHAAPPRDMPENFGFPCVSPVESLRIVSE